MKSKYSVIALLLGLTLGLGPWYFVEQPGWGVYATSVVGGLLVCFSGMGAQMKQLGLGDTSEELLSKLFERFKQKK